MQKSTRRKPRRAFATPISLGGVVKEDLPLPYVHYPNHYGTFFAFSEDYESNPYLCSCSLGTISNYIKLRVKTENLEDIANHHLHYPDSLQHIKIKPESSPEYYFQFKDRLCHRCNLTPPTMRYCHEMYGVRFIQHFGWYVNQCYLRFGILPRGINFIEDVTPEEFVVDINKIVKANIVMLRERKWFSDRDEYRRTRRIDPSFTEPEFNEDENRYRQDLYRDASKKFRQVERVLSKKIENIVREEFGFRKVGERWTSETLLYYIVCKIYPDSEIQRHHRPDWLEGLELDIFIPELKLAFEYQGQQHFHPIEAWGGEKALLDLQERDRRKAMICKEKGICLITFDYSEPLLQDYLQNRINDEYESTN